MEWQGELVIPASQSASDPDPALGPILKLPEPARFLFFGRRAALAAASRGRTYRARKDWWCTWSPRAAPRGVYPPADPKMRARGRRACWLCLASIAAPEIHPH